MNLLARPTCPSTSAAHRRRRGMALLLVMVGMVVCTILTAGFLATQGTSIGIARNERDAQKSRTLAQTGLDLAFWQIRNTAGWRSRMSQGYWLNNVAVGDGTVSVYVQDGDNTGNFSDDPSAEVILTSTGTYDGRTSSLRAVIKPTGGGTVFRDGNFIAGSFSIGNTDLLTAATVDSYDSSAGAYNPLIPGANAAFATASNASNSLTVYLPSMFRGSYTAGPTSPIGSVLNLVGALASGPSSISQALEARSPGKVIAPNTAGLVSRGTFSKNSGAANPLPGPGSYTAVSASGCPINITSSGIYYVSGNMSVGNSLASFVVSNGVTAVVLVDGNITINGRVTLLGTSSLALYANNAVTMSSGSINSTGSTGSTSAFTLFGTTACTAITLNGNSTIYGSVYAPQAAVTFSSGSSAKLYGAIIANSITMRGTSQIHFDEALKSLRISNLYGGSAPSGSADYTFSVLNTPCTE